MTSMTFGQRSLPLSLLALSACVGPAPADKDPTSTDSATDTDTPPTEDTGTTTTDTSGTTTGPPCDPITTGSVWFQDKDGDCLDAAQDCDDLDPDVNGAEDVCDGKDNDCDGTIDDDVLLTWYVDNDGDGYAGQTVEACAMPAPWRLDDTLDRDLPDCDDTDASVHPDEPEEDPATGIDIPGDGVDQDCDGSDACAPVCIGSGCGFATTDEGVAFREMWGQAPDLYFGGESPGLDLTGIEPLCAPPAQLRVHPGDPAYLSLAGLEAWFPTEEILIEDGGSDASFYFQGLSSVSEIPTPITIRCSDGGDNQLDVGFEGLAGVDRLAGLEFDAYWGYECWNSGGATDLTGLGAVQVIDGDLYLYRAHYQSLDGLEALEAVGGSLGLSDLPDLVDIAALGGLRNIGGNLYIDWSGDPSPLAGVESIGGTLALFEQSPPEFGALTSLGGLYMGATPVVDLRLFARLTSLPLGLWVSGTDITSLSGLDDVTSVGGLRLAANPSLTSLDGLGAVTEIDGDLYLSDNPALTSLAALGGVRTITGAVTIKLNDALTDLGGLSGVETIGGDVFFNGNHLLTGADPLSVATVGGSLELQTTQMTSLDGFAALTRIEGDLLLTNNSQLTSLTGLHGLQRVGGSVLINNNSQLTDAEIYAFLDHLGRENVGRSVYVNVRGSLP